MFFLNHVITSYVYSYNFFKVFVNKLDVSQFFIEQGNKQVF